MQTPARRKPQPGKPLNQEKVWYCQPVPVRSGRALSAGKLGGMDGRASGEAENHLGTSTDPDKGPDLDSAAITNRDLLSAMRELRWFFDKKSGKRSAIDYRNMGPEELGSVYE